MRKLHFTILAAFAVAVLSGPPSANAQDSRGLDPSKAITQYVIRAWTQDDGLPQNSINAITQTDDGFLWLGTQEGLVRFDGIELRVFDKSNTGLLKKTVSTIQKGADNTLWVGTREGGVSRFDMSTLQFTSLPQTSGTTPSAMVQDRSGTLWVGTNGDGLFRIEPSGISIITKEGGLPGEDISALHVDSRGDLWVGTREAGLWTYDGSDFRIVEGLPQTEISSVVEGSDGTMWIGTREFGMAEYRNGLIRLLGEDSGLPSNNVTAIYEDISGSVWVGTQLKGISRYRDGKFEVLSTDNGLVHDDIETIFQDREGSLWVGTSGGLAQLRNGRFTTYTTREGLALDVSLSVFGDINGDIWIGSEGGGVSRFSDGAFTVLSGKDGLSDDVVSAIARTRDGSMWFGTIGGGLNRYKDGKISVYTEKDGLPTSSIFGLYTDSDDILWIATDRGGLTSYKDGRFNTISIEDGISSQYVTVVWKSVSGDLWVGTYDGGLNQMRDGEVIAKYTKENGLLSDFVTTLFQDTIGIMWVGTRDGGLHRIENGRLTAYSTENGLFDDTVQSILADDAGNLWITCNKGLFKVSRRDLNDVAAGRLSTITSTAYGKSDGLLGVEFNGGTQPAAWRGREGRLWFPSNYGVVAVDPAAIPVNKVAPGIVMEDARADGVAFAPEEKIAPGANKFEFRYAGISFVAPHQMTYQYRLDGYDEEWVEARNRREAFYTNLKPGPYTFRVRARNSDGVWAQQEATRAFTLRPFFHQTIWFYLVCALGVALIGFIAYRWRVNRLKVRQRELEQLVEERTRDLRDEKEKTEEALRATEEARRDAERQKEIAQQAKAVIEAQADKLREMDRIKSRFFGNISHEFRTPLTLTIGPLENALTGVYGKLTPQLAKQLEVMLRNSRRLLRLINQLLDLTKLESGNLDLKLRKSNVFSLVEGVVLSFTAFAEKEGINLNLATTNDDVELYYDSENLEKVFFNLLSNAVKFTPEGGSIDVAVAETKAVIRGAEYEVVEIKVRDTGAGIPANELPHIFDRFHQVDGTVSRVQEGTGIGLSLVKELVDLHGGRIKVDSTVSHGTEFTVLLPKGTDHLDTFDLDDSEDFSDAAEISHGPMVEMAIFDDHEAAGDGAFVHEEHEGPRETILVVDDNLDIRDYVVGCLSARYNIATAKDGVEGLAAAREIRPDLIISDVMMPRMDGYELCRSLKSDPELGHLPVILLTSKASLEAKIEGLEAGSDDYIAKPFNARELRVRVSNLLNIREQAKALKGLNEELLGINDALREASELKTQLLSIASHDMKNPLTAIREFARIIKDEVGEDSHLMELLDLIYSSSNEMLHLVTQLLDSAALESGKLKLDKRPVDLAALARLIVHRNSGQADRKGQTLHFEPPPEGTCIAEADFNRLQEAMDNLVSNAIKYSPHDKRIWIDVTKESDVVRFAVRDEGPGITEEDRAKLFGKFQKLSNQPTGGESSTGLGLSIVKQIIEMHDGRVWAESEVGEGSRFVIELKGLFAPVEQT